MKKEGIQRMRLFIVDYSAHVTCSFFKSNHHQSGQCQVVFSELYSI